MIKNSSCNMNTTQNEILLMNGHECSLVSFCDEFGTVYYRVEWDGKVEDFHEYSEALEKFSKLEFARTNSFSSSHFWEAEEIERKPVAAYLCIDSSIDYYGSLYLKFYHGSTGPQMQLEKWVGNNFFVDSSKESLFPQSFFLSNQVIEVSMNDLVDYLLRIQSRVPEFCDSADYYLTNLVLKYTNENKKEAEPNKESSVDCDESLLADFDSFMNNLSKRKNESKEANFFDVLDKETITKKEDVLHPFSLNHTTNTTNSENDDSFFSEFDAHINETVAQKEEYKSNKVLPSDYFLHIDSEDEHEIYVFIPGVSKETDDKLFLIDYWSYEQGNLKVDHFGWISKSFLIPLSNDERNSLLNSLLFNELDGSFQELRGCLTRLREKYSSMDFKPSFIENKKESLEETNPQSINMLLQDVAVTLQDKINNAPSKDKSVSPTRYFLHRHLNDEDKLYLYVPSASSEMSDDFEFAYLIAYQDYKQGLAQEEYVFEIPKTDLIELSEQEYHGFLEAESQGTENDYLIDLHSQKALNLNEKLGGSFEGEKYFLYKKYNANTEQPVFHLFYSNEDGLTTKQASEFELNDDGLYVNLFVPKTHVTFDMYDFYIRADLFLKEFIEIEKVEYDFLLHMFTNEEHFSSELQKATIESIIKKQSE